MFLMFDVVVLGYGLYTIYSAIKMKRTQELSSWLVGAEAVSSIRDAKGYIGFIYPRIIAMGAMAILFGMVSLFNDYVMDISGALRIMVGVFLAVCVWFYYVSRKAKEKYW